MRLRGRIAVVTGGASGLGKAIAKAYSLKGAKVVIADNRQGPGLLAEEEIRSLGGDASFIRTDVALSHEVRVMVNECVKLYGGPDILVNNAGIRMEERKPGMVFFDGRVVPKTPTHELEESIWERLISVNLTGAFLCSKYCIPYMMAKGWGCIINVTSSFGYRGDAERAPYVASKHGLEGLTKALAMELKRYNISVNSLHPGGRANVDGRGGMDPEVMVPPALFLATQESPKITGRSIIAKDWPKLS